jgi:cytochrome c oxidase assembly protein subunit 15
VNNIGLYRCALAVSLWLLLLVGTGAALTTVKAGLAIPDWPLAFGTVWPTQHPGASPGAFHLAVLHRLIAALAFPLVGALAIWAWSANAALPVRAVTASALALLIAQLLLGGAEVLLQQPQFVSVLHACLAQLCFALVCCAALLTSPEWTRPPQQVHDYGWPSLRSLAIWTPALVFIQILLGALFRHHVWSVVPHILGAMFVSGVVLLFGLFVLTQFPDHEALRKGALAILMTMLVQVLLGVFTYVSGSAASESTVPGLLAATVIVAHVVTGGILFVSSLVLAMQVRRHVLPRLVPAENMQAAS